MSIEHEIKARITEGEFSNIYEKLMFLGAKHMGNERHKDVYYSTGNDGDLLRVRLNSIGGQFYSILTYKGSKMSDKTKTRREEECRVEDGIAMAEILSALGNKQIAIVNKKRDSYTLGRLNIFKDDVDGLGEFVEIEIVVNDRDYMIPDDPLRFDADKFILDFANILGLADVVNKSYLELMMELGKNVISE